MNATFCENYANFSSIYHFLFSDARGSWKCRVRKQRASLAREKMSDSKKLSSQETIQVRVNHRIFQHVKASKHATHFTARRFYDEKKAGVNWAHATWFDYFSFTFTWHSLGNTKSTQHKKLKWLSHFTSFSFSPDVMNFSGFVFHSAQKTKRIVTDRSD